MSTNGQPPPLGEALLEALIATLVVAESAIAEDNAYEAGEALTHARRVAARLAAGAEKPPPPPEPSPRDQPVRTRAERLPRVPLKRRKKDVLALLKENGQLTANEIAEKLGLTITVARRVVQSLRDDDLLIARHSGVRGQPTLYSPKPSNG